MDQTQLLNHKKSRPSSAKSSQYGRRSARNHIPDLAAIAKLQNKLDKTVLYRKAKVRTRIGVNTGDTLQIQKFVPKKIQKSRQRLYEQNILLRKKINELENIIRVQRTKMENDRRNSIKYVKKLNMEFQNELYWHSPTNSQYVVFGIKNQYEKLKQTYNEKCKQNDRLKRIVKYTQLQELTAQLETYKSETERLKMELDKSMAALQDHPSDLSKENLIDLKKEVEKYQYDIEAYENGLRSLNKIVKQKETKILFLEKLIIEKQNGNYKLEQTNKKLTHDNQNLKQKNKELKELVNEMNKQHIMAIQQIRQKDKTNYEDQIQTLEKQLELKNTQLVKQEKELINLSQIINQTKIQQKSNVAAERQSRQTKEKSPSKKEKSQSAMEEVVLVNRFSIIEQQPIPPKRKQSSFQRKKSMSPQLKPKHYTLKRLKVKNEDVKDICDEIKYRLLLANTTPVAAKELLIGEAEQNISIAEIIDILSKTPFNIKDVDRRILLARYLVEDQSQSVLFYDEERSAPTKIVQSIFEQFIPKSKLHNPEERQLSRCKTIQILSRYHQVLSQAISQVNKQQIINYNKFTEVMNQQQLYYNAECNSYMIMVMVQYSLDINHLQFRYLLNLVPHDTNFSN